MKKQFLNYRVGLQLFIIATFTFGDGLPGEYLLSSRWRDLFTQYSPLSNPSVISKSEHTIVRGAFAPVLQGAFKLWEIGVTIPIEKQALGVTFIGESDGYIHNSTIDPSTQRLMTTDTRKSNSNLFSILTYSFSPIPKLSLGVNGSIAYQSNFSNGLTGVGADLGLQYELIEHSKIGRHSLGLSTVNLIAPALDEYSVYSRDLRLSWYGLYNKNIESGIEFDVRDFWSKGELFTKDDLTEKDKKIEWGLSSRIGTWFYNSLGIYGQAGFDNRILEYLGFAFGVRVPLIDWNTDCKFLYQYSIKTEGTWASAHTFYVISGIGKKKAKSPPDSQEAPRSPLYNLQNTKGITVEEESERYKIIAQEVAIHFASGSAELPKESYAVLKEISNLLRSYPDRPVIIEGHTDNTPIMGKLKEKFPDNQSLSQARCEAVKDFFTEEEKLPKKFFTAKGWGDTKPIAPNDTKEGRIKNRRVIITIDKIGAIPLTK